jgi:hypothetical protein
VRGRTARGRREAIVAHDASSVGTVAGVAMSSLSIVL